MQSQTNGKIFSLLLWTRMEQRKSRRICATLRYLVLQNSCVASSGSWGTCGAPCFSDSEKGGSQTSILRCFDVMQIFSWSKVYSMPLPESSSDLLPWNI
eukprot:2816204-Karenia_brevis.AAC.1